VRKSGRARARRRRNQNTSTKSPNDTIRDHVRALVNATENGETSAVLEGRRGRRLRRIMMRVWSERRRSVWRQTGGVSSNELNVSTKRHQRATKEFDLKVEAK
jgi:hypothetical protein